MTAGASMLASVIAHNDVVINAAGVSSPHSPELHDVDRDGAIAAIRAAEAVGVRRFIQISAMPADRPDRAPAGFRTYLRAQIASDTALASSRLVWTVVRPGALVDRRGKGRVMVGTDLRSGSIPRDDLAALVVGYLAQSATSNRGFDVVSGRQPIDVALASVA
ncbi:NAD(P)H-binding protein [Streptomyces sp. NPDC002668]|uniref:NAD(P)H-binding protein n=1 Tax=Streptomyces sp. NPDC002668 TaxID=3154422 RepID=UPI003316B2A8